MQVDLHRDPRTLCASSGSLALLNKVLFQELIEYRLEFLFETTAKTMTIIQHPSLLDIEGRFQKSVDCIQHGYAVFNLEHKPRPKPALNSRKGQSAYVDTS